MNKRYIKCNPFFFKNKGGVSIIDNYINIQHRKINSSISTWIIDSEGEYLEYFFVGLSENKDNIFRIETTLDEYYAEEMSFLEQTTYSKKMIKILADGKLNHEEIFV